MKTPNTLTELFLLKKELQEIKRLIKNDRTREAEKKTEVSIKRTNLLINLFKK